VTELYRQQGVAMLPTARVAEMPARRSYAGELILAPLSAGGTTWVRRFGERETAFASGWMRVRGTRRRKGYDRGFVLSDHADWPGLLRTIEESRGRARPRDPRLHGRAGALPPRGWARGPMCSPRSGKVRGMCDERLASWSARRGDILAARAGLIPARAEIRRSVSPRTEFRREITLVRVWISRRV
jgi:hypothetical protein